VGVPEEDVLGKQYGTVPAEEVVGKEDGVPEGDVVGKQDGAVRLRSRRWAQKCQPMT